ncbi:pyridoxamine 5'-phosphate oxidase family protein [Nocardia sp. NBC_00565]|uniref:pyridoxamine 5'-phosphate oxidase family protein n=1 Tax=Nocardia sp. NBC_00565 TaxID=2975993 RepID=UPI002E81D234|nr:pyridoxamine 5'-phosphate oxidase family protein [Nocardia sp. NBC_00565]WUC04243.1 pyridoxamine 5'-phosphate oxidase family protein [Nocardia sp. NBC_00565]
MALDGVRESRELSVDTSLHLLGTIGFGRVAFSRYALPAIRPVSHAIVEDHLVLYADSATTSSLDHQVVAYEVDAIDHHTHLGWCVIVTGIADTVRDEHEIVRYQQFLPARTVGAGDRVTRILPDIVTGIEYVGPADTAR